MKSIKLIKGISLALVILLTPSIIFSKESSCGYLDTASVWHKTGWALIALSHNDKKLKLRERRGGIKIPLKSGWHQFTAVAVCKDKVPNGMANCKSKGGNKLLRGNRFGFLVKVEAGINYKVAAVESKPRTFSAGERFHATVLNESAISCNNEYAKEPLSTEKLKQAVKLPSVLAFRLGEVMSEVAQYYKNHDINDGTINYAMPSVILPSLGLALDFKNWTVTTGLLILGVSPGSSAYKFGLLPGDYLLSFNEHDFQNTNSEKISQVVEDLKQSILQLNNNEEVAIHIIRDNKKITLNKKYQPIVFPSYSIKIDLEP